MKQRKINESDGFSGHSVLSGVSMSHLAFDATQTRKLKGLAVVALITSVLFGNLLLEFVRFSLARERNSYLIVVPFISLYLIWIKRKELMSSFRSSSGSTLLFAICGLCSMALSMGSWGAQPTDQLSLRIFSYLCFLMAGGFYFVGSEAMKAIAFPLVFLVFAIPMPTVFSEAIEVFLQYTSAEAAYWMISLTGIPILRTGLEFRMPGIAIRVAQECSGYNSSFVLFMVSTLAGYLFLQSTRNRWVLTLAVVPLAIVRNGFRISTLSVLCVKLDPSWIDSPLHHRGGPIFFALSLIPFLVLLWTLRRIEAVNRPTPTLTR